MTSHRNLGSWRDRVAGSNAAPVGIEVRGLDLSGATVTVTLFEAVSGIVAASAQPCQVTRTSGPSEYPVTQVLWYPTDAQVAVPGRYQAVFDALMPNGRLRRIGIAYQVITPYIGPVLALQAGPTLQPAAVVPASPSIPAPTVAPQVGPTLQPDAAASAPTIPGPTITPNWRNAVRRLLGGYRVGSSGEHVTLSGSDVTELRGYGGATPLAAIGAGREPVRRGDALQFRSSTLDALADQSSPVAAALGAATETTCVAYLAQNAAVAGTMAIVGLGLSSVNTPWAAYIARDSAGQYTSYRQGGTAPYTGDSTGLRSVASTWDGATVRLYIDGVLATSYASAVPMTGADTLAFGMLVRTNEFWQSNVDVLDVFFCDAELDAMEILAAHNNLVSDYGYAPLADAYYDPSRAITPSIATSSLYVKPTSRTSYAAVRATVTGDCEIQVCRTAGANGSKANVSVWLNGAYHATHTVVDYDAVERIRLSGLPANTDVTARCGLWGLGVTNTCTVLTITGDNTVVQPRPTLARRLAVWGDSITAGGALSDPHQTLCWNVMRPSHPGEITIEAYGGATALADTRTPAQFATDFLGYVAGATTREIWIAMAHNDWSTGAQTAAAYAAQVGAICDAINASDSGALVYWQSPVNDTSEATPNGLGETLADYRAAIAAAAATRVWVTYVDGDGIIDASTQTSDGVHPDPAGNLAMAAAWLPALGL